MKSPARILLLALCGFVASGLIPTWAHQPVMDMAPRWQNGYGFQIRQEFHQSDNLAKGTTEIDNPLGLDNEVNTTWLEGIYTFKRELRISVKMPYLNQQRTINRNGLATKQTGYGLGDTVIGLLLKSYTNEATATSNIAITPSIRLPTGSTADDYPTGDGSTDLGISLSASWEKADLYQYYDLFYWNNQKGDLGIDEGDEIGFDVNVGLHPYHNNFKNQGVFVMVDASLRYQERGHNGVSVTGGKRLHMGPVFVYYLGGMMFRAEYKYPVYEDVLDTQVSRGPEFNVGIGLVF